MWRRPQDLFTACAAGTCPSSLFGQPVPFIWNLALAEITQPLQVSSDVTLLTSLLLVGDFQLLPPSDKERVWRTDTCGQIIRPALAVEQRFVKFNWNIDLTTSVYKAYMRHLVFKHMLSFSHGLLISLLARLIKFFMKSKHSKTTRSTNTK